MVPQTPQELWEAVILATTVSTVVGVIFCVGDGKGEEGMKILLFLSDAIIPLFNIFHCRLRTDGKAECL